MYSDRKDGIPSQGQEVLQTAGKEKPVNRNESKVTQINRETTADEEKYPKRLPRRRRIFEVTKQRRQNFQIRSRKYI